MNVYPYFSIENEDLPTQWAKMLKRYPQHAHKIRLTETGWPSDGTCAQHASTDSNLLCPINLPKPHTSPRTTTLRTGSPNFAGQTATQEQGESYYNYYLKWACDRASEGSPATETFYYAYFDGRAPPKAPDYEQ